MPRASLPTSLARKGALILGLIAGLGSVSAAMAQQAQIAFGNLAQDTDLPVSVEADQLRVDNADGTAVFSGNVRVAQGEMRLTAAEVRVEYGTDSREIARLHATGGVTIANLADAAEAREAVYTIDSGTIVMTGQVLVAQGANALSGQKLTINLKTGTGTMEGRVSTTFTPRQGKN